MKFLLSYIITWLEFHPVISAGIFTIIGAILSAVFDLRNRSLKIISKTKTCIKQSKKISNKNKKTSFLNNWFNNCNFFTKANKSSKSNEDLRQDIIRQEAPLSPLTPRQIAICERIAKITEIYSKKYDPKSLYEKAVREKNINGVESAALNYFELFNKIVTVLQNIAVEKNAKIQIENLIAVVEGLYEMLDNPTDQDTLERQFTSCEGATLKLIVIIHEPA